jgi:hypothetical protein
MTRRALRAAGALGRSIVFSAALWTTGRIAALPLVALWITRRLAPPELRHLCDREAGDDELVALADQVETLQVQIDEAYATRGEDWTLAQESAHDEAVVDPLADQQRALIEQAQKIRACSIRGYRARARMLIAWHNMLHADGKTVCSGVDPDTWALMRDLTGRAA